MSQEGNLIQGPEAVETADLHFKSLSKLKVFEGNKLSFESNTSLLAVCQYYGLVFVGTNNGFLILKAKEVFSVNSSNEYHQKEILLNSKTSHIAVNFEQKYLAVGCQTKMGPIIYIYDITSFLTKGVSPKKTVPLSKPYQNSVIQLSEVMWQPNNFSGLTICFSDGSVTALSLFQGTGNDMFSLPNTTQARCLCWSPKGKQLVIGSSDGTLSQYKPDLKFIKKLPVPPLFSGAVSVVSVLWISSFQFAAAYKDQHKSEEFPVIVIVNASKNEPVKFINYDDITYSSAFFRNQLYFCHQSAWNIIFVASANSIEVAVLHGKEDNTVWEQWLLGDASRAELPLNADKVETYPIGIAVDYTSDQAIPWGEDTLPPAPRLLLLNSEGVLTTFNIINMRKCDPQLTSPPKETFDDSWFTLKENNDLLLLNKISQSPVNISVSQTDSLENTKPTQTLTSNSALPLPGSMPFLQTNLFTPAASANFTVQSSKDQVAFPSRQLTPDRQSQLVSQEPPQTVTVPVTSNQNSSLKWTQKPPFSFSFNTGITGNSESGQTFANKDNELFKNVDQNLNVFGVSTIVPKESVGFTDAKEKLGLVKEPAQIIKTNESSDTVKTSSSALPLAGQNTSLTTTPNVNMEQNLPNKKFKASPTRSAADLIEVSSKIYVTALMDEIEHFDTELKEVLSRVSALRVHIGTDEEKLNLRKSTEKLNDLEKDLRSTAASQKNKIHSVRSDVIEAFAWLEDARSRNRQRKSRTYIELKKSEDLDPLSSRIMSEISHLKYYIENQLKQLHSYLMREWMEHEYNCRLDIKSMMIVPSLEELYKTMHLELKILNNLRATVEELRQRVAEKNLKARSKTVLVTGSPDYYSKPVGNSSRTSELYKLADDMLQMKIDRDETEDCINITDAFQLMMKNQINEIWDRSKKFTALKQNILRDTFCEREMIKTRSVKSKLGSSYFIRNNSSRIHSKYYSNLRKSDTEETIKSENKEFGLEANNLTSQTLPGSCHHEENIVSVQSGNENKVDPNREAPVPAETNILISIKQETLKPEFGFGTSSSQKKSETGNKKEFTFVGQPAASDTSSSATEKSEIKTGPFVFKAAPVFSFGLNVSQAPKSIVATSGTGLNTGNMQTVIVLPSSSSTSAVAFKGSDLCTTPSTTNEFMYYNVKTSSSSVKTCTSLSSSPEVIATTSEIASAYTDIKTAPTASEPNRIFSFPSTTTSASVSSTITTFSTSIFKFTTSASSVFKFTTSATFSFSNPFNSSKTNTGGLTFSFPSPALSTTLVTATTSPNVTSPGASTSNMISKSKLTFKGFAEANAGVHLEKTGTGFGLNDLHSVLPATTTSTATTTTITNLTASTASDIIPVTTTSTSLRDSLAGEGKSESESGKCDVKEDKEQNSVVRANETAVETLAESKKNLGRTEAVHNFSQQSTTSIFTGSTTASSIVSCSTTLSSTPSATTLTFSVSGKNIFNESTSASTTASIFSTTSSSIFSSAKTVTANAELFNSASATTTSSSNIFGHSLAVTSTANASPLSQAIATTSNASSFGQSGKDELGQTATLFSDMLRSGLPAANVFQTPTTSASGNIFGKSNFDKSGSSIFGNAATSVTSATATTGLLENTSNNIFMKSSFGQIPSSGTSNLFGQPQREGSTFLGQNICSSFGSTATTTPNQNPFANLTGFNSRPVFEQNLFDHSSTGQNPLEASSTTNIFGSASSNPSGGNIFQIGSSSFSNSTPAPFSSSQSTSSPTSAFQKPMGGFGGSPVFGSGLATTATFGAPPAFGASNFGSSASFGSSQKIFGSPQGTFGQNQPNFGSLANESADGFADLAQRNPGQTFGSNTFNQSSTFGTESSFKGESFSIWRS